MWDLFERELRGEFFCVEAVALLWFPKSSPLIPSPATAVHTFTHTYVMPLGRCSPVFLVVLVFCLQQTVGEPEVAVSTLVMAGSLVQVPTVAVASTTRQGGAVDVEHAWRRFRILAGFLHVMCRLVVVSERRKTIFCLPGPKPDKNKVMTCVTTVVFTADESGHSFGRAERLVKSDEFVRENRYLFFFISLIGFVRHSCVWHRRFQTGSCRGIRRVLVGKDA